MRTSNPVLGENVFTSTAAFGSAEVMTVQGTVSKTLLLLLVAVAAAALAWSNPSASMGFSMIAAIVGFVLALIISFKPVTAPYLAPVYAFAEGMLLGAISAVFNVRYPGIAVNAALATFGVLFVMLTLYRSGIIKVDNRFKMVMMCAVGGIMVVYVVNMIMGFFGSGMGFITSSGPMGIIFSLVVCGVAAFSLMMDFDFIEQGSRQGAPKYMEWYGAFALMVTLVWLYLEILRLLSKLSDRK
ncbi:MAG: Bax inhibitor-1/YccA family protein [Elusimicrobiaceae bacterium]